MLCWVLLLLFFNSSIFVYEGNADSWGNLLVTWAKVRGISSTCKLGGQMDVI